MPRPNVFGPKPPAIDADNHLLKATRQRLHAAQTERRASTGRLHRLLRRTGRPARRRARRSRPRRLGAAPVRARARERLAARRARGGRVGHAGLAGQPGLAAARTIAARCIWPVPSASGRWCSKRRPRGSSLNGAPPSDAMAAQLQRPIGLRSAARQPALSGCWAFPIPAATFELTRNDQDRALAADAGRLDHRLRSLHADRRRSAAGALGAEPRGRARAHRGRPLGLVAMKRRAAASRRGRGRRRPSSICFCTSRAARRTAITSCRPVSSSSICAMRSRSTCAPTAAFGAAPGLPASPAEADLCVRAARALQGGGGMPAGRRHQRDQAHSDGRRGWAAAVRMRPPVWWRSIGYGDLIWSSREAWRTRA